MLDINYIKDNQELLRRVIEAKGVPLDLDALLEANGRRRALELEVEALRQERNQLTKTVEKADKDRDADKQKIVIEQARAVGTRLQEREDELARARADFDRLMLLVPNPTAHDVPFGRDHRDNVEVKRWGHPRQFDFAARTHVELAAGLDLVDWQGARQLTGSRGYALRGEAVILELALMRLALDRLIAKGFTPIAPPLMVRQKAMEGTGYFPLGQDNAYELERDRLFLIGTAEVGLVGLQAGMVFDHSQLPIKLAGISQCFRREAGAAGKDSKGLYRVHQFQKVEQVIICPNDVEVSQAFHQELLATAEEIMQDLDLPYRVVSVCTGDIGLGQVRKHDIEAWMPSRSGFGETHSCSTMHDFQARRLGIKYKDENGQKQYVHTLNNTALASPRILIPILENYQNSDGSVTIPEVLRPYMGARTILQSH